MNKMTVLKLLMRFLALVMGIGFGLSHLFFPSRYFGWMGQSNFNVFDPFQLFLANVAGVIVISLCVGLWIAASDPIRYRVVVIMFIVAGTMMVPVFFIHLVFTTAISGWEWLNMILLGIITYVVCALYPWREKKSE
jgi:hypothetical protein